MNLEEQLKYLIERYTDYMLSTNPEKGEFDLQTHINLFQELITKEIKQARIDELKRLKAIDCFNEPYTTDPRPAKLVLVRLAELNKD